MAKPEELQVASVQADKRAIAWRFHNHKPCARLIRIDGHSGTGKTSLAKALSEELGCKVIEADDFLNKQFAEPRYAPRVIANDLRRQLRLFLEWGEIVIVAGCCLEQLVPVSEFGEGYRIYVCRHPDNVRDEQRRQTKLGTDDYHAQFKPHLRAHLLINISSS